MNFATVLITMEKKIMKKVITVVELLCHSLHKSFIFVQHKFFFSFCFCFFFVSNKEFIYSKEIFPYFQQIFKPVRQHTD